ncbi:MAG TPA: hypothetical protein VFR97_10750 [Capillimicrobium sp.]|nr:hypothetical protein [Capillimicrobium sp.]
MTLTPTRIAAAVLAVVTLGVGIYAAQQWVAAGERFVARPDPPATRGALRSLRAAGFDVWWLGRSWRGMPVSGVSLAAERGRVAAVRYGAPACDADACRYPVSVVSRPGARPLVVATGGAARPPRELLRRLR